jgi:hypothetical protein
VALVNHGAAPVHGVEVTLGGGRKVARWRLLPAEARGTVEQHARGVVARFERVDEFVAVAIEWADSAPAK